MTEHRWKPLEKRRDRTVVVHVSEEELDELEQISVELDVPNGQRAAQLIVRWYIAQRRKKAHA